MHDDGPRRFATTHWTLIVSASDPSRPDARSALGELCRIYWYPLYAFLRRQGHDADEAQELTQGFFAKLVEKGFLTRAVPERGRFRSFLLASLKHYASNEHERARAQKRGGGTETIPIDTGNAEGLYTAEARNDTTPEHVYERQSVLATLTSALGKVKAEYADGGRADLFEGLEPYLVGDAGLPRYAAAGTPLSMSEGAVRVAVHRLRRRFRAALLAEIAATVADDREVEEELRYLSRVLAR